MSTTRTGAAARRTYDSTTVVFPGPDHARAARAIDVVSALEAVRQSTRESADAALHAMRRAEVTRRHAAGALEASAEAPVSDEAARARLREQYGAADREVALARAAADRARALESAASLIARAFDDAADVAGADAARALLAVLTAPASPAPARASRSPRRTTAVAATVA